MAVYARGYRRYEGGFDSHASVYTIFREHHRMAFRNWGLRIIGVLFLIWFAVCGMRLYVEIKLGEGFARHSRNFGVEIDFDYATASLRLLKEVLIFYHAPITALAALVSLFVGAGLISDDMRTRALPLYLVRPVRPIQYVIGKTLVLPVLLLWFCLVPGLAMYALVSAWQPEGESMNFFTANTEIVWAVFRHYAIAAMSYTGLMVLLSARISRRGSVMGVAAAVYFVGSMLALVAATLRGWLGDVLRLTGLPENTLAEFIRLVVDRPGRNSVDRMRRVDGVLPDQTAVLWVAAGLLLLGMYAAYRRAKTVEISE